MSTLLIYLLLAAIGFYLGKYLGAVGLCLLYFSFFHQRRLSYKPQPKKSANLVSIAWAYRELGVSETSDIETIKRARKKLINHYHPDKLGHASEDENRAAAAKVNRINRAFEAIQQVKGFQ